MFAGEMTSVHDAALARARLVGLRHGGRWMSNVLVERKTPEQEEAENIEREMGGLEAELAGLSSDLTGLEIDVRRFMQEYTHRMAPHFARFDRWRVRCDEIRWTMERLAEVADGQREMPESDEASSPENAWREEREEEFKQAWEEARAEETAPPEPTPDLSEDELARAKKLHRELARRYHPDLANSASEDEQEQRTAMMAQINEAWENKDLARLEQLRDEPDIHPPEGESIGDRIVRLIRKRASVRKAVAAAKATLEALWASSEGQLYKSFNATTEEGGDAWEDVTEELNRRIQRAQEQWVSLREEETELWTELD